MQVTASQARKMVDYVEQTQPLLLKAAETEAKVAVMAPKVVDLLIEKGALDRSQRDRAIINIQNPVKALESLQKFAASVGTVAKATAPETLGAAEKVASVTGERQEKMSEADRIFLTRFGF